LIRGNSCTTNNKLTGDMQKLEMIPYKILLRIFLTLLILSSQIISSRHGKRRLWDKVQKIREKDKDIEDDMNKKGRNFFFLTFIHRHLYFFHS